MRDSNLVNVKENHDGTLSEVEEVTNMWAWKYPRKKMNQSILRFEGDVRFKTLTSYIPEKPVLKDLNLYAEPGEKLPL